MIVVLFFNGIAVQQVSLKRWVLYVQDLVIELLQLGICHLLRIQSEEISEDDFELLCSNVTASIFDLLTVGGDVLRLSAVSVSVLSEHSWNIIALFLGWRLPALSAGGSLPFTSKCLMFLMTERRESCTGTFTRPFGFEREVDFGLRTL